MLGLDRRTFPFAVVALAVWVLWVVVVPAVDDAVPWEDVTEPGDVFQVTPKVTMTPAVGWGVQSGLRTTDRTRSQTSEPVILVDDGVTFQIITGPWAGTPAELLGQSTLITESTVGANSFRLTRGTTTIRTSGGDVGVLEGTATPTAEGLTGALVFDGRGLQINAAGPPQQLGVHAEEIGQMIASISDEGARS